MSEAKAKIELFVARLVQQAMNSGLTWDEAVAAFGLAAKATAAVAAQAGDGTAENCLGHARKRLEESFTQVLTVVWAGANLTQLRAAYAGVDARALLENCNFKIALRH
ncbi:type IV secretory system conjugative DNA transfer family protein [Burkholderia glumae]|uniref:type IV secretory system conjugative DNA transfer family protein n=1 Tax=Burkholderia glumae TaxID=337 RepID=UPI002150F7DF|nr:type IV secretory system conjugative DNA transfer family protein [Burkholderia glumae]